MKILVLGATWNLGKHFIQQSNGKGHTIDAVVRKPVTAEGINYIQGNVFDAGVLSDILTKGNYDAVVNLLGGGLTKSTVLTESTRLVVDALSGKSSTRYVGISVLTLMPKTIPGYITAFILSNTFLRHVDRDHHGALESLKTSSLDWTMVACGQIVEGAGGAVLKRANRFTGGYRQIQMGDVANEIWRELEMPDHHKCVFGVWSVVK